LILCPKREELPFYLLQETLMAQWYAQIDGQRYGPASEEEIKSWYAQGRVKPTDFVWSEGMASWSPASAALGGQPMTTGFAPSAHTNSYGRPLKPHRATAVLVLGILGLVVCTICGIIAWVMGNNDLREMAAGRMDRSGEGMTRAGRICGMIATILMIVGVVFYAIALAIVWA
jgi:hypothetical protein